MKKWGLIIFAVALMTFGWHLWNAQRPIGQGSAPFGVEYAN